MTIRVPRVLILVLFVYEVTNVLLKCMRRALLLGIRRLLV